MGTLRDALSPNSHPVTSISRAFQELCDSGMGKLASSCAGTYYLVRVLGVDAAGAASTCIPYLKGRVP